MTRNDKPGKAAPGKDAPSRNEKRRRPEREDAPGYGNKKLEGPNRPST